MTKQKRRGRAGAADHLPRISSSEEARRLGMLGGRPSLEGGAVSVSIVLRADQVEVLRRRGINRSELVRSLLDEWLSR